MATTYPGPQGSIAMDGGLIFNDMREVRDKVEELKAIGYDGIYSFEGSSDGFNPSSSLRSIRRHRRFVLRWRSRSLAIR